MQVHQHIELQGAYALATTEPFALQGLREGLVGRVRIGAGTRSPEAGERTSAVHEIGYVVSGRLLIVTAISDRQTGMAIEISAPERKLGGLRIDRPAFLHLDEYNIDPLVGSFDRHPRPRVLGRFSRQFMNKVTRQLADNIKAGRSKGNDRRQ